MKHYMMKYARYCLLAMASTVAFVSCSDDDEINDLASAEVPAAIELTLPPEWEQYVYQTSTGVEVLPLLSGQTVQMGYVLTPDDATFDNVVWNSSNTSVATVDDTGLVTAVAGDGSTYSLIQVTPWGVYSSSGITDNIRVMVSDELIEATGIELTASSNQLYAGESLQLTAAVVPSYATYQTFSWSSSDESVATVDSKGLVTGVPNDETIAPVTITATALDGSGVQASITFDVIQIVQPQDVDIDQTYSVDNGYYCAIADGTLTLDFTTEPADCTYSLLEWSSSDESIATVANGVVTFNSTGNFGDFTITATCPETGNSSSIRMSMPAGLIRELFRDENHYTWYNASQSGNGTQSSHEWHYGYVTVTTYSQNDTNQRGDFKCWSSTTYVHAGNYPIFAIKMDDVIDLYGDEGVTSRNINLDGSGSCNGTTYSGNFGGSNNKWLYNYKCSDGSHVFIYDFSQQEWPTGGMLPANAVASFGTFQFKYADIRTISRQITYNVYWVQTFRSLDEVGEYIRSEGLTYEEQ